MFSDLWPLPAVGRPRLYLPSPSFHQQSCRFCSLPGAMRSRTIQPPFFLHPLFATTSGLLHPLLVFDQELRKLIFGLLSTLQLLPGESLYWKVVYFIIKYFPHLHLVSFTHNFVHSSCIISARSIFLYALFCVNFIRTLCPLCK